MFGRNLTPALRAALRDNPVVLVHGARQTGKTTLVRIEAKRNKARYLTLDDAGVLSAASSDPVGFVSGLDGPVVLDEVQHVPALFPAIKSEVDRRRQPGRFLLTGSANVLLLPRLSESLAGRMEILTLWPLSQGEIDRAPDRFVDAVFRARLPAVAPSKMARTELAARIVRGGYPEVVRRASAARRRAWFGSYLATILQRDVREIAGIEGLTTLPRLLQLLATRSAGMQNFSDISRDAAMPQTTLKRYMTLLEATHLLRVVPAWFRNLGKRLMKAPKLYLDDTGLLAHLLGVDARRLLADANLFGPFLESFVAVELVKQSGWSRVQPATFHFRTHAGEEVDVVLEAPSGEIVGIEVKSSATVGVSDFRGLKALAIAAGSKFRRGIVLHTGAEAIPFGGNLHALPIDSLWQL